MAFQKSRAAVGKEIFDLMKVPAYSLAMSWLESFADCGLGFVYISNGNNKTYKFYIKHGFLFSHDVFDRFITAAYKFKSLSGKSSAVTMQEHTDFPKHQPRAWVAYVLFFCL